MGGGFRGVAKTGVLKSQGFEKTGYYFANATIISPVAS
jgi:hypothetical protein